MIVLYVCLYLTQNNNICSLTFNNYVLHGLKSTDHRYLPSFLAGICLARLPGTWFFFKLIQKESLYF